MVSISNVMGIQVLYPKGKINLVIQSCLIGAITDLRPNICLIPSFSYEGTAIAYLGAEVVTTVSMYFIGKKYLPISFLKRLHLNYLGGCVVMSIVLILISQFVYFSYMLILMLQVFIGIAVYGGYLWACKDPFIMQALLKYIDKFFCMVYQPYGCLIIMFIDFNNKTIKVSFYMNQYDYLIVGAGLFGATFAYFAHKQAKKCLVIDKRLHLGGNVYCENMEGINVHK